MNVFRRQDLMIHMSSFWNPGSLNAWFVLGIFYNLILCRWQPMVVIIIVVGPHWVLTLCWVPNSTLYVKTFTAFSVILWDHIINHTLGVRMLRQGLCFHGKDLSGKRWRAVSRGGSPGDLLALGADRGWRDRSGRRVAAAPSTPSPLCVLCVRVSDAFRN